MVSLLHLKLIKFRHFSIQQAKRCISTMANPLIAVCQMRSIADKEKNLEVLTDLAAEAKRRSAVVCIYLTINIIKCSTFYNTHTHNLSFKF